MFNPNFALNSSSNCHQLCKQWLRNFFFNGNITCTCFVFVFSMKLTRKWFQITERVYSTKFWVRYLVILLHYGVNSIAETSTCELRAVFFTLHWKTQMYLQLTYIYQNISKNFELSTYRACNCGIGWSLNILVILNVYVLSCFILLKKTMTQCIW